MKKILVIEDNQMLRENTAELLELNDYQVFTATNGRQGVEMALLHQPHLVICDIMMPEMNGYEVLQHLQNTAGFHETAFIFLTAMTEKVEVQTGLAKGADEYIAKPFDDTDLLNAVERQFNKGQLQAAG